MVCHTMFVDMQKLIKSTWKIMTKINNNSIFNIWGVNWVEKSCQNLLY